MCHNVGYDGDAVSACLEYAGSPIGGNATDRDEWAENSFSPLGDAREPSGRPFHLLQQRRVDRPERHISGRGGQCDIKLFGAVRTDAKLDVGIADCLKVCSSEVFLAEMYEVRPRFDRLTPVVVDHQLAFVRGAKGERLVDLRAHHTGAALLDAELHEFDAFGQKPCQPVSVRHDGVERIEADHLFGQEA